MRNHQALLAYLLRFGEEQYAQAGGIAPMVHVMGDLGDAVAMPAGPVHVADWMPPVVFGLTSVLRASMAGVIAEAWMKVDPGALDGYERGTLERLEGEGDPGVETVLICGAVSRLGSSWEVRAQRRNDDGALRWEPVLADAGFEQGAMPEGLAAAFARALDVRPPETPDHTLEEAVAMVLTVTGSEGTLTLGEVRP